jgi:hypothetical protein
MRTRRWLGLALAGGLLAASGPGRAAVDLRPFGAAGVAHDDNVFRFADEAEAVEQRGSSAFGDTVRTTSAGLGADFDYGRQALRAAGELQHFDYGQFDELDRTEGAFKGAYYWSLGLPWTGLLRYDHSRKLEPLVNRDSTEAGFQTLGEAEASAGYELAANWQAQGGVVQRRKRHTRDEARNSDLDETRTRIGLAYASALGTAGVAMEYARGTFPNREAAPDSGVTTEYGQTDYLLRAANEVTGLSSFEVEFGYTIRTSSGDAGGYRGPTGRLRYDWRWSRQTTVGTQVFRRLRDIEERDANFVDELGMALRLERVFRRTLAAVAEVQLSRQDFEGAPATSEPRSDQISYVETGLSWTPRAWLSVKPTLREERRVSSLAAREYAYTVAGVTVEVRPD